MRSRRRRRARGERRRSSDSAARWSSGSASFGPRRTIGRRHDGGDGLGEAGPRGCFGRECFAALGRDLVILGAAVVAREAPVRLEELALLEAVEGGVERALLDAERV